MPQSEVLPPAEERLFTNWSSKNSSRERVAQHVQSARSVESHRTANQAEQNVREPDDNEVLRYVLRDATHTPSDRIQISQVGARLIDRETNTSEVETRLPREEMRTDRIHTHSKGIQVPSSNSELSSHDMHIIGGSLVRPHIPNTMPQLDRPLSIRTRRKRPVPEMRRYTTMPGGSYPDDSESDSHDNRSREGRRYPGRRRYYQDRGGRPPDREGNQNRGYLDRGRPQMMEDPLMVEDPLMMEDPLIMEDPLMIEDPQEMEDCQDNLEDKDHQAHQYLLDPYVL